MHGVCGAGAVKSADVPQRWSKMMSKLPYELVLREQVELSGGDDPGERFVDVEFGRRGQRD